MRSEYDPITDDLTFKYKTSTAVPTANQVIITTDSLLAELTSAWDLKVRDLTTNTQRFQVAITKPTGLSSYKLTSTDKYLIIFYRVVTSNTAYEYILPISKTNGAKLWTSGMQYTSSYSTNTGSGSMGDIQMVMDYPGNKFFVAWEWALSNAISIKKNIIGPNLSNTGTEEPIELSISPYIVHRLEGLGIVNGNEFVIYTTILTASSSSITRILKMWRKNMNYASQLVSVSYIGTNPSNPHYKGVYVVDTLGGQKIVLVYSQVTTTAAKVMYKLFNDDGSSASSGGNPIVISQNDIEVNGVVFEGSNLFMIMGPLSGVWYLGNINFING